MTRALLPLVPLYAAAVAAKNLAWDRGLRRPRSLQWSVVSVGNLSVGGSGKTPLTMRLAALLHEQGIAVDVLSRGYGRRSAEVARVDPGGSADEFGDEPLLIAQATSVPVYVGGSRYAAGVLAEQQNSGSGIHLLDDGFQHRQLARDLDIVVLHRSDFAAGMLPAGRLREPFSSLARAQILVMRDEDRDLEPVLRRRGFHQPLWWMTRELEVPALEGVIAFCAVAHPEEFLRSLHQRGTTPLAFRSWRDHHRYTRADIVALHNLVQRHKAHSFLTTEKDLVRLSREQRTALAAAAPLHTAQLRVRLDNEAAALAPILALPAH